MQEGSHFKGQPQIRMLLNYVKNAVTEEWQQLPYVLMLFAAESSCILVHPENPHFMTITRYLLKGPALDLEVSISFIFKNVSLQTAHELIKLCASYLQY